MSMPTIPNMKPDITVNINDTVNMLLSSIAMEEMGLSHIINAEAEKLQYVLGTLNEPGENLMESCDVDDLLNVNKSLDRTLRGVLKNQMLLQLKLEDVMDLYDKVEKKKTLNECINDGVSCAPEYFDGACV